MTRPLPVTDSFEPWRVVLCAIDPGEEWGASIFDRGELTDHGYANDAPPGDEYRDQKDWVWCAYHDAEAAGVPLIFVIESWQRWGTWTRKAQDGLVEHVGVWKHFINKLPKRRPTTKIVRIKQEEWRKKIFGYCRRPRGFPWKARAIYTVKEKFNVEVDHNAAEAILLGYYASMSYRVGELPGVRKRARAA